jgi:DNA-binding beta-propeller fold protein YncE
MLSPTKIAATFTAWLALVMLSINSTARAQSGASFGPETFTRVNPGKDNYTRNFNATNTSIPYTLTITNGASDGSQRVRKAWLIFNDQLLLDPTLLNSSVPRITLAIHPQQQNVFRLKLKGGDVGSFVRLSIEPARTVLLRDLSDPNLDANQAGVGTPFSVAIDQATHRAYVSDRYRDSVIEMDITQALIISRFTDIDGDSTPGDGGTSGICFSASSKILVAVNEVTQPDSSGSLAVIDTNIGSVRTFPILIPGEVIHPKFVAVNTDGQIAAFDALYNPTDRHAYFMNLSTGALSRRDDTFSLIAPVFNPATNEFVYLGSDMGARPVLVVYSATPPFQRVKQIDSSATAGTTFDRLAINPVTNIAVAVHLLDSSVYLFDLTAGTEIARIPIILGQANRSEAFVDVAINPDTNMAVVISKLADRISVVNLTTKLVAAELPLPPGVHPLGVGIDRQLNRAVIAENGLASSNRNGTVLVAELPSP